MESNHVIPCFKNSTMNHWPADVGILAMEVYFPSTFVDQEKLEKYDGVSKGKYTIGLGQYAMGFCGDREDVNSMCLTVLKLLIEKNRLNPKLIGRLEVGTETIIDKSKSVKSVLMQLFVDSGNYSVEGIDTTNACYGGTQALFNALAWIESSSWDGRLAIVIAADIAVYAAGNARPSGGAGAVAMLVGPNAPLVVERGLRGVHMEHAYDFYKPNMESEYPVVDGKLSVKCYFSALDKCYQQYKENAELKTCPQDSNERFCLNDIDYLAFHTPYCKIVQKSVARLVLQDFLQEQNPDVSPQGQYAGLEAYRNLRLEDTFKDEVMAKEIERATVKCSSRVFEAKAKPSLLIARNVGNMYTPSLYGALASFLINVPLKNLCGKRIVMFSYGSGLAASMFSIRVSDDTNVDSLLTKLVASLSSIPSRLKARREIEPEAFVETLQLREKIHHKNNYTPSCSIEELFGGTFYLQHVDEKFRRSYDRKPSEEKNTEHVVNDFANSTC